jgi:tetratricopeptide (TPR) repeat protein
MLSGDDIYGRALQLGRAGQTAAAVDWLQSHRDGIAAHAGALGLMGTLLSMLEQPAAAVPYFMRSITLNPAQPVAYSDLGIALTNLNRPDEALACFDQALALNPRYVQALNNRSLVRLELQQGEPALIDAEAALALQPGLMPAHRQRANALLLLDRPTEALESIDTALSLAGDDARNHAAKGEILDALGRHDEALVAFDRAVSLSPADADSIFGRGCSHLRHHTFEAGWRDYQSRWSRPRFVRTSWRHPLELLARRDDHARLTGQRVLIVGEQGIGDEIMFASVIPDLLADASHVAWIADERLQRLLRNSFPTVEFASSLDGLDLAAFDHIIPAGDLCRRYRNSIERFGGAPYLRPSDAALRGWSKRLGPGVTKLRIGLSWKGGVFTTGQHRRSLDLAALKPLLEREDCEFVSLQYGEVQDEIDAANAELARPIRSFPKDEIGDFEDLAGLVLSLDAVVSVQTALVHLAGAVGAPCFAMISSFAEWRYGDQGEVMPWYGGVKLVRQTQAGSWRPVLARIGEELDRLAGKGSE